MVRASTLPPEHALDLLEVVQELSMARDLSTITTLVRSAARRLTSADGATFVLRDNGDCYYLDEEAIAPLWKGKRFPLDSCVSGWVMTHRETITIEDIYLDARVPHEAYRPTFVRSLAMVPIRTRSPIGAIGAYWAQPRRPTPDEVAVLSALADSTSIAMEHVQLIATLEARVAARTRQLEAANREMEQFSYAVAHELRTPIGHVLGFAQLAQAATGTTSEQHELLTDVIDGARQLNQLVEDLLRLANLARQPIVRERFDLSTAAREIGATLALRYPEKTTELRVEEGLYATGDPRLMRIVLDNLLGNAWKYAQKTATPIVELGTQMIEGRRMFFVRDNGAGFDEKLGDRLFLPFQRLHGSEFAGTGVGLSTVKTIIQRHDGRIWAESKPGHGATFWWYLGEA